MKSLEKQMTEVFIFAFTMAGAEMLEAAYDLGAMIASAFTPAAVGDPIGVMMGMRLIHINQKRA